MKRLSDRERMELTKECEKITSEIDQLYWIFSRTARGRPPILVRPDLYKRRNEIERMLTGGKP